MDNEDEGMDVLEVYTIVRGAPGGILLGGGYVAARCFRLRLRQRIYARPECKNGI